MSLDKYKEIAIKYRVEDLTGALIPGSRLSNILKHLELGEEPISNAAQDFLPSKGLLTLLNYARKEVDFSEFVEVAGPEQSERRLVTEAKAIIEQAEQNLKNAAMQALLRKTDDRLAAEKRAFDNDPRNIGRASILI